MARYGSPTLPGPTNLTLPKAAHRAGTELRAAPDRSWPITSRRPPYGSLLFFLLPQTVLPPPSTRARGGARVRRFFAARLTRTCSQVRSRRTSPLSLRALVSFLPVRTVHSGLGGGVGGFALPRALIPWPLAEQGGWRCSVSSIVWSHSSD